jgi:biopolymer transport protein ExbD
MVDVVLVILIFFMAGTSLINPEWFLRTESLKRGRAPGEADPFELSPVWLTVDLSLGPDGQVTYTGLGAASQPIGLFAQRIADFAKGTPTGKISVVVNPAADVPYSAVIAIHESCAAAGIERVGIGK